MIAKVFKIKCLTNMHVGSGDVNFNIIDNEVERDAVTNYPTINASGVKGALREFFEVKKGKASDIVNDIFGPEKSDGVPGKIRFLCANMLAIPMRASGGEAPYYMVTTQKAVDAFNSLAKALLKEELLLNASLTEKIAEVEGVECKITEGLKAFGIDEAAVMTDEEFGDPTLPVVARNKLENGKSANLWFEEIVPHESVFYFFAVVNDCDKELLNEFTATVTTDVVQFGGNATVGYGICEVKCVGGCVNE